LTSAERATGKKKIVKSKPVSLVKAAYGADVRKR